MLVKEEKIPSAQRCFFDILSAELAGRYGCAAAPNAAQVLSDTFLSCRLASYVVIVRHATVRHIYSQ